MPKPAEQPPEPRTSSTVAAEITAQADARRAAEAELDRLTAARPAMLLDLSAKGDAALDAHDIATGRQRRVIERSDAVVTVLETELAQFRVDEDQAARVALYAEGQAAASEVADLVLNDYPDAARAVVDVLMRIAEAGSTVAQANANLPAGAVPLRPESFRNNKSWVADLPALAASVVLPAARASEASIWPMVSRSVPYDPGAARRQREWERDERERQTNAVPVTEPVPKMITTVLATDAFDRPDITVSHPDLDAWHRERDAREERKERERRSRTFSNV
ncbi:hypothetical protein [Lichenibacterium ramalinae]|uniref:Uncharacterized protein n=1 Tax=Lichenibacterium ramalinae TaxID=2316527 RepID=A0A4Q2REZ0_9HYPH|nr:hypothetical protein [Lichenibacterium ramalinae]RYB06236.1 hypothetical protein D3272_05575 [Lichenibacterium ramalinae]